MRYGAADQEELAGCLKKAWGLGKDATAPPSVPPAGCSLGGRCLLSYQVSKFATGQPCAELTALPQNLILEITIWGSNHSPHFTEKETETWGIQVTQKGRPRGGKTGWGWLSMQTRDI